MHHRLQKSRPWHLVLDSLFWVETHTEIVRLTGETRRDESGSSAGPKRDDRYIGSQTHSGHLGVREGPPSDNVLVALKVTIHGCTEAACPRCADM